MIQAKNCNPKLFYWILLIWVAEWISGRWTASEVEVPCLPWPPNMSPNNQLQRLRPIRTSAPLWSPLSSICDPLEKKSVSLPLKMQFSQQNHPMLNRHQRGFQKSSLSLLHMAQSRRGCIIHKHWGLSCVSVCVCASVAVGICPPMPSGNVFPQLWDYDDMLKRET